MAGILNNLVGNKAKGRISKQVLQENKARQIFRKTNICYPLIRTRTYQGVERNVRNECKKCSFFGKFDVLCFLEIHVLRFALLPYYGQSVELRKLFSKDITEFVFMHLENLWHIGPLSNGVNILPPMPTPLFASVLKLTLIFIWLFSHEEREGITVKKWSRKIHKLASRCKMFYVSHSFCRQFLKATICFSWIFAWRYNLCTVSQQTFTYSKLTMETQEKCGICSKLTIKTPEPKNISSVVFIVNFEHILHLFLMFLSLTLKKHMYAGSGNSIKRR